MGHRHPTRRALLAGIAATPLAGTARAQAPAFPSRRLTIIVPYGPGGYIDVVARIVADGLRERSGQQAIVLNRPGGNGLVGLGELARAAPDGHTLLMNNDGGICVQAAFDRNFRFEPGKDFAPLARIVVSTYMLAVRNDLPARTITEFLAHTRAARPSLTFGSPGQGTTPHIGMEYLARRAGAEFLHVPYPGITGSLNDLMAGRLDMQMSSTSNILSFVEAKKLRVLAVLGDARVREFPDTPTMAEAGLPGFAIPGWLGLFGPPGMDEGLRASVSKVFADTVTDPRYAEKLRGMSVEPTTMQAGAFAPFYFAELAKWKRFADESGIKVGE